MSHKHTAHIAFTARPLFLSCGKLEKVFYIKILNSFDRRFFHLILSSPHRLCSILERLKKQQKLNEHQLTTTMGYKILLSHKATAATKTNTVGVCVCDWKCISDAKDKPRRMEKVFLDASLFELVNMIAMSSHGQEKFLY